MAYAASARNGLDREAWLGGALLMWEAKGVEGVRVGPLAKQLGVTKGSFYWHFTNREALLVEVLNHWARQLTTTLGEEVGRLGCEPAARLWRLRQMISESEATAYELAMRSWAAFDRLAADTVQKVDRERMAFVQSQFAQLGFAA